MFVVRGVEFPVVCKVMGRVLYVEGEARCAKGRSRTFRNQDMPQSIFLLGARTSIFVRLGIVPYEGKLVWSSGESIGEGSPRDGHYPNKAKLYEGCRYK